MEFAVRFSSSCVAIFGPFSSWRLKIGRIEGSSKLEGQVFPAK